MANALMMIAALTFIGSATWLIVSLFGLIRQKTRHKSKRNAVISLSTIVASFATLIVASFFVEPPQTQSRGVAGAPDVTPNVEDEAAQEVATEPKADTPSIAPVPTARPANEPSKPAKRELLPTQEARLMCRAIDESGLGSAPCSYSGWESTITMTIDTTANEARKFCQAMAKYSRDNKMDLGGWRLEIRSPYSGNNSIAFCKLA